MGGNIGVVSSRNRPARRHRRLSFHLLLAATARLATPYARWMSAFTNWKATGDGSTTQPSHERFELLFVRYQTPLLDYLYGMTRDREWAADLTQETFLRAFAASPETADISYPQAWLYRIATNLALTALRRRKRFGWLALSAFEPGSSSSDAWHVPAESPNLRSDDIAATVAERDAVWQVLAELPPRWRAVLLLQTTAGFGVSEIAAQLSLSEANVRKLLFRAKERFREIHARIEATGGAR